MSHVILVSVQSIFGHEHFLLLCFITILVLRIGSTARSFYLSIKKFAYLNDTKSDIDGPQFLAQIFQVHICFFLLLQNHSLTCE